MGTMKCQARIVREYKTKKADSIYPFIPATGEANEVEGKEICGGTLSVSCSISDGGCSCCGSGPELDIYLVCSRCKYPWASEKLYSAMSSYQAEKFVGELLEKYIS